MTDTSVRDEHVCSFTIYSHTSFGPYDVRDVYLCAGHDCPAWDYGPPRDMLCACGHQHVNPDGSGSCSKFTCPCRTFRTPQESDG